MGNVHIYKGCIDAELFIQALGGTSRRRPFSEKALLISASHTTPTTMAACSPDLSVTPNLWCIMTGKILTVQQLKSNIKQE